MSALDARARLPHDLRDLADWLEQHPHAPASGGAVHIHIEDGDEFDVAVRTMGVQPIRGRYDTATLRFGTVTYKVQTDGDLARREARVARRERELGLAGRS
jgi:hypothetical protein